MPLFCRRFFVYCFFYWNIISIALLRWCIDMTFNTRRLCMWRMQINIFCWCTTYTWTIHVFRTKYVIFSTVSRAFMYIRNHHDIRLWLDWIPLNLFHYHHVFSLWLRFRVCHGLLKRSECVIAALAFNCTYLSTLILVTVAWWNANFKSNE